MIVGITYPCHRMQIEPYQVTRLSNSAIIACGQSHLAILTLSHPFKEGPPGWLSLSLCLSHTHTLLSLYTARCRLSSVLCDVKGLDTKLHKHCAQRNSAWHGAKGLVRPGNWHTAARQPCRAYETPGIISSVPSAFLLRPRRNGEEGLLESIWVGICY